MVIVDLGQMTKKFFQTADTELEPYNGKDFVIIGELEIGEFLDKECAPMFSISFEDGFQTDAFPDEIFTDESLKRIYTPEFLKEYRGQEE